MNPPIHSTAQESYKAISFFAVFWTVFSFLITYLIFKEKLGWPVSIDSIELNNPVFLILFFPLIGIFLLSYAFKLYLQWKKHGLLDLYLNPEQGSIGGDIGGEISLPIPYRPENKIGVVISCIKVSIHDNSRHESVIWRKHAAIDYDISAKGIKIRFCASIDDDLPPTSDQSGNIIQWIIRIVDNSPGVSTGTRLDRKFEIPVFKYEQPKSCSLRISNTAPVITVEDIPEQTVQIEESGSRLTLYYPRFRSFKMAIVILIFSLAFIAPTVFMLKITMQEPGHIFQTVILSSMTAVFGLFGFGMLMMGLYLLTNKKTVVISRDEMHSVSHSMLLFTFNKRINCNDISAIKLKINMTSGQGADATAYYQIAAETNGKGKLILGDGIKGQLFAESLAKRILDFIGRKDLEIRSDLNKLHHNYRRA